MRKIICIIILSCLLIDMTGSWLMFGVCRQSAKKSMQYLIHSSSSKKDRFEFLITPQNAALFEFEEADELSYQGVMYDVINKKQDADTLHVICLMDKDETVLVNNYNNIHTNCIQENDNGSIKPFHFFYSVYEPSNLKIQLDYSFVAQIQPFIFLNINISKAIFAIVKPPPKVLA